MTSHETFQWRVGEEYVISGVGAPPVRLTITGHNTAKTDTGGRYQYLPGCKLWSPVFEGSTRCCDSN